MTVSVYAPGLTVAVVNGPPPAGAPATPPPATPPVAAASAQPTPFLTTDDGTGPQRDSMVSALWLPWPTPNNALLATHKFVAAAERFGYDVTATVRKFIAGDNTGFELRRPKSDPSNVSFAGRTASGAPTLTVVTDQGTSTLPCDYFSAYNRTTFKTIDTRASVGIGSAQPAQIHFDLSSIKGAVQSAVLALTALSITFGAFANVEVYELAAPRIYDGGGDRVPEQGIAAGFDHDAGIASHPACLWVGNFQNARDPGWHNGFYDEQPKLAYDDTVKSWVWNGSIKPGGNFGLDAQVWLDGVTADGRPAKPAWQKMYMRQYIYLNDDFFSDRSTGYKFPGIGVWHGVWHPYANVKYPLGGYWDTGSTSGRGSINKATFGSIYKVATGQNAGKWAYDEGSYRGGMYPPMDSDAPTHPYKQFISLDNTPYHIDMTATDGGLFRWPCTMIRRGRWYCIEQALTMNTIDTSSETPDANGNYSWNAARFDGRIEAWIDGVKIADSGPLFRFVRNPALGCRGLDGNWYFGGRPLSTTLQTFRWRDVVLATQYIGPRKEAA